MKDYTYDFADEVVLGAHILEVSPAVASSKPKVEAHPLGIGSKEARARLLYDCVQDEGVAVCMTDMGDHFRLKVAEIEIVAQPEPVPNLPVAHHVETKAEF